MLNEATMEVREPNGGNLCSWERDLEVPTHVPGQWHRLIVESRLRPQMRRASRVLPASPIRPIHGTAHSPKPL